MNLDVGVLDPGSALARGVDYLIETQHRDGRWTDFWLPVGTSDAWVTAYVGLALHRASACPLLDRPGRARALGCSRLAATWLLSEQTSRRPCWGYNRDTPTDADTTAHAISLLARVGYPVPVSVLDCLCQYKIPGEGYITYRWSPNWAAPADDITAAALRALYDAGRLDSTGLAEQWRDLLGRKQDESGWWQGYWWRTPNYTTGLTLEVWQLAGRPALAVPVEPCLPTDDAFDLAWATRVQRVVGLDAAGPLSELLALQSEDGGWPSAPILRVPPERDTGPRYTYLAVDARRLFVTATVVCALSEQPFAGKSHEVAAAPHSGRTRSGLGSRVEGQVGEIAGRLGFPRPQVQQALDLFMLLTAESFAEPAPWPAEQLTSLSGGVPIEFSATVGPLARPGLRYAVEVGNPYLEPYRRARCGVAAIARVAERLGYQTMWERILPGVDRLVRPELAGPEASRFWVWGGMDQSAPAADDPHPDPALKIYVNLMHLVRGGSDGSTARSRLESALAAVALPLSPDLRAVLDTLDGVGFLHEAGFGFTGKQFACKVYYELHGWRRDLVRRVLDIAGLAAAPVDMLSPAIPGIMVESLAAKQRAGIAFRIDPVSGKILELTTALAFPAPFIAPQETTRRVQAWIDVHRWQCDAYQAAVSALLPAWEAEPYGRLHSLLTRTVRNDEAWASIYLRPRLG